RSLWTARNCRGSKLERRKSSSPGSTRFRKASRSTGRVRPAMSSNRFREELRPPSRYRSRSRIANATKTNVKEIIIAVADVAIPRSTAPDCFPAIPSPRGVRSQGPVSTPARSRRNNDRSPWSQSRKRNRPRKRSKGVRRRSPRERWRKFPGQRRSRRRGCARTMQNRKRIPPGGGVRHLAACSRQDLKAELETKGGRFVGGVLGQHENCSK